MRRDGATCEEYLEALKDDPETADWYNEKGKAKGHRECKRAWSKAEVLGDGKKKPVVKTWGGGLPLYVDAAERVLVDQSVELFQRGEFIVRPAPEIVAI